MQLPVFLESGCNSVFDPLADRLVVVKRGFDFSNQFCGSESSIGTRLILETVFY